MGDREAWERDSNPGPPSPRSNAGGGAGRCGTARPDRSVSRDETVSGLDAMPLEPRCGSHVRTPRKSIGRATFASGATSSSVRSCWRKMRRCSPPISPGDPDERRGHSRVQRRPRATPLPPGTAARSRGIRPQRPGGGVRAARLQRFAHRLRSRTPPADAAKAARQIRHRPAPPCRRGRFDVACPVLLASSGGVHRASRGTPGTFQGTRPGLMPKVRSDARFTYAASRVGSKERRVKERMALVSSGVDSRPLDRHDPLRSESVASGLQPKTARRVASGRGARLASSREPAVGRIERSAAVSTLAAAPTSGIALTATLQDPDDGAARTRGALRAGHPLRFGVRAES